MSQKLLGKVAVVTGGGTGIGFATAKRFIAEGAFVYIVGRRQPELDEAVKKLEHNAAAVACDVSNLSDLDRLYDTVKRQKGRIDVLYGNAGIYEAGMLESITESSFDRVFGVNAKGLLFTVQKALPLMPEGAAIVLTGSVAGSKGLANSSAYCATKAVVRSFARTWALELAPRKIRVNVVSPGVTDTQMAAGIPQELLQGALARTPISRMGHPDEMAKAVVFLASEDSSYTTGAELFVDGGSAQI